MLISFKFLQNVFEYFFFWQSTYYYQTCHILICVSLPFPNPHKLEKNSTFSTDVASTRRTMTNGEQVLVAELAGQVNPNISLACPP